MQSLPFFGQILCPRTLFYAKFNRLSEYVNGFEIQTMIQEEIIDFQKGHIACYALYVVLNFSLHLQKYEKIKSAIKLFIKENMFV